MGTFRILLVLVLAALLDLGGPLPPEVSEPLEEVEEAVHGRRRLVRLASQHDPPSTRTPHAEAVRARSRPGQDRPRPRASAAAAPVRKTPAPPPEPASVTEDH